MALGITVLGSGSQGNSILIHNRETGLLVDAGFSRKETLNRLETVGLPPAMVKALLVTHEHEDHVKGCRLLSDSFDIPSYMTTETYRYMKQNNKTGTRNILFDPGTPFQIEEFYIEPFAVQHDALQTVGFVISDKTSKVGVATDLGQVNNLVKARLSGCDALILEANYDQQMLRDAKRPLFIKRRIMGRHGHLNNEDAVKSFDDLLTERTKFLFLAHISGECNSHELVRNLAAEKLKIMKRTDIVLTIAEQAKPSQTIWIC
jgi:phosphoribosyl 1,2-cyclic phosphodiesterase